MVEPTDKLPKLTVEGVMLSAGCTPLPLKGTTALTPCELEILTLPVTVSELSGLKVMVMVAELPAASVSGVVIPLIFTSLADALICEMVRLEFPLLVSMTFCVAVLPALMLPKLTLAGLGVIVAEAATPAPVKVAEAGEFGALLEMLTEPFNVPAVDGANTTLNEVLLPGARLAGVLSPATL